MSVIYTTQCVPKAHVQQVWHVACDENSSDERSLPTGKVTTRYSVRVHVHVNVERYV